MKKFEQFNKIADPFGEETSRNYLKFQGSLYDFIKNLDRNEVAIDLMNLLEDEEFIKKANVNNIIEDLLWIVKNCGVDLESLEAINKELKEKYII